MPQASHRSPPKFKHFIRKLQRSFCIFHHADSSIRSPTDTQTHAIVVFNRIFRVQEVEKHCYFSVHTAVGKGIVIGPRTQVPKTNSKQCFSTSRARKTRLINRIAKQFKLFRTNMLVPPRHIVLLPLQY